MLPGVVRVSADIGELSGLGLLTWVYRPGLVDRVVAACGRGEQRRRLLPARLVVYFVLALALFSPAPYLEVMRHLVEGLWGQGLLGEWHIPAKSSLFRARQRLGSEPLWVLFATTAKPMGIEATPGCFWRGLRLLAVDGTCWDVADSPANEAAFGRPGNSRGHDKSSFLQVRMACLVEVGTHLVLDVEPAGCQKDPVTGRNVPGVEINHMPPSSINGLSRDYGPPSRWIRLTITKRQAGVAVVRRWIIGPHSKI
ncbi:transposase domain-containing protein [Streptomyces sp. NPDC002755]